MLPWEFWASFRCNWGVGFQGSDVYGLLRILLHGFWCSLSISLGGLRGLRSLEARVRALDFGAAFGAPLSQQKGIICRFYFHALFVNLYKPLNVQFPLFFLLI